jgi:hypothetical protein
VIERDTLILTIKKQTIMRKQVEDFFNQHYRFDTIEDLEDCVCDEFEGLISGIGTDEEDNDYVMSFGLEDDEECLDVTFTIQTLVSKEKDIFGNTTTHLEIVDYSIEEIVEYVVQ